MQAPLTSRMHDNPSPIFDQHDQKSGAHTARQVEQSNSAKVDKNVNTEMSISQNNLQNENKNNNKYRQLNFKYKN